MSDVTIYHNPACSQSRAALALIREAGFEPRIVEYLTTPLERETLAALLRSMGMGARELVREKEPVFAALGLRDADEGALLEAMLAHPVLINRPIVATARGARLCRPPETVLQLLPPRT